MVDMEQFNVLALAERIPDEAAAYRFLEDLRWADKPVCPHCGSVNDHYFLNPQGEGRKTRTGKVSARRVWKCKDCRKQFSVLTGTIFHGTKIPGAYLGVRGVRDVRQQERCLRPASSNAATGCPQSRRGS